MYANQNTRNGESLHLNERLRPDSKAELLREKAEIEKRLRAIDEALKSVAVWKPRPDA